VILFRYHLFLPLAFLAAGEVCAQKGPAGAAGKKGTSDPGVRVEMFESANLDRFIRSAQASLAKDDYEHAIKVLQEVIEGRTGEFMAEAKKAGPPADVVRPAKTVVDPKAAPPDSGVIDEEDPAYSVFSSDNRIYRPVARLCHELLASMPAEGMGLYRIKYEAYAEKAYHEAASLGDLVALEAVYNRYFVTLSAARSLHLAVDLLMDVGRFRAAIQNLESLLDVYPADGRKRAGIQDLMLMVKVAICYQQLGDLDTARDKLARAAKAFPEASVRLMGELHTIKDMRDGELFDDASQVQTAIRSKAEALNLLATERLSPMWEYRFVTASPYRSAKSSSTNSSRAVRFNSARGGSVHGTRFPQHRKNIPGTSVLFGGGELVFLDNFRPVVHDLLSGRQVIAMGDTALATYKAPRNSSVPRSRTPVYDYFGNRVASDAARYYCLEGYNRASSTASFRAIHTNSLTAYARQTGKEVWRRPGKVGKERQVTYLTTPTVYRSRLLVPFLEAGIYGVLCLSAVTGDEVFRTYLHSGGTEFARAPSPPAVVEAGIAYILTNAGVLAAVDANTGTLNWSRKYERIHPTRGQTSHKTKSRYNNPFSNYAIAQFGKFSGFAPSNLHVAGDLILLAAADSTVLLCLNAANGKVLWMQNAARPKTHKVLSNKLSYVVGKNDDFLFIICGESQLLCIDLRSGVRHWVVKLPGMDREGWRGRGVVTADYVALPGLAGSRTIHVVPADTRKEPDTKTLDLPSFSIGKESLGGPVNLQVDGAYLAVSYEGGVEIYSAPDALALLAANSVGTELRASYLVHSGKLEESVDLLLTSLDAEGIDPKTYRRVSVRALGLVGEVSSSLSRNGQGARALEILEQVEQKMRDRRLILRVHLFRLQAYRVLGDQEGVDREQDYIESGGLK
jgi:outer membrane protein assembly factor BamB/tetratricopeptide (TPR) repeat protein